MIWLQSPSMCFCAPHVTSTLAWECRERRVGAPEPTGVLPSAVPVASCSDKMQDWVTVRNLQILKGWHKLKEKDQTKPVCGPIQLMGPRPHLTAVSHPWLVIWEGHESHGMSHLLTWVTRGDLWAWRS